MSTKLSPFQQHPSENFRECKSLADVMFAAVEVYQETPDGESDLRPTVAAGGKYITRLAAGPCPEELMGSVAATEDLAKSILSFNRRGIALEDFIPQSNFFAAIDVIRKAFYPAEDSEPVYLEPVHVLIMQGVGCEQIVKMTGISLEDARKYSSMRHDEIPQDIPMPALETMKAERKAQCCAPTSNGFELSLLAKVLCSMGYGFEGADRVEPEVGQAAAEKLQTYQMVEVANDR